MVNVIVNSCRVCLNIKIVENEIWRSITEIDDYDNNLTISDKIQLLSGMIPNIESGLAQLICQHCITNLKIAYDFQLACRNSENVIEHFLAQHKNVNLQGEGLFENKVIKCDLSNEEDYEKSRLLHQELYKEEIKEVLNLQNIFPEIKVEVEGTATDESDLESIKDEDYDVYEDSNGDNSQSSNDHDSSYQLLGQSVTNTKKKSKNNTESTKTKKGKVSVRKYSKLSSQEKIFVCELCGNVYKKRALLTDHMRWHTGSKDFKCEICGKAFLLNTYLARHVRTHTGIRNYKCNFCSRTFYTNGLKRAHEKVHTGERCYKCELCDRKFSYSQSLQRHMLVHSGVKPHKCEDCGKEFRQESHLKQHMATNIHQNKQQHQKLRARDILQYSTELF